METEAAVAETGAREAQTEGIQFGSGIWGRTPRGQDKSRNIHSTSSGSGEIHSDEEDVADYARDASVEIQRDAVVTEGPGENVELVESDSCVETSAVSETRRPLRLMSVRSRAPVALPPWRSQHGGRIRSRAPTPRDSRSRSSERRRSRSSERRRSRSSERRRSHSRGRRRSRSRGRSPDRSRGRSPDRSRGRSPDRRVLVTGPEQVRFGLQRDLVPRPAINSKAASRAANSTLFHERPAASSSAELASSLPRLPSCVCGNFMISTWIIGCRSSMQDLAPKLRYAPFDVIIVIMSSAVDVNDQICLDFERLSVSDLNNPHAFLPTAVAEILYDKAVHRVSDRAFAVIHRAKVECCNITRRHMHDRMSGYHDARDRVEATTLSLTMCTQRQRLGQIRIGWLHCNRELSKIETQALIQWLVNGRIAMLAVAARDNRELVETLAVAAAAIGCSPVYQDMRCWNSRRNQWENLVHPSYFLLFGLYRTMQWPTGTPTLPNGWELGDDIRSDMILSERVPQWERNDLGSTSVPHLGAIKMKPIDWSRWLQHTFQTCVWLGTAIPSKSSQSRQLDRGGKGSGKARGSGGGRGYGG